MTDAAERIRGLEVQMSQVQEGVANFRQFQKTTADFISWFRGREEERDRTDKRRARIHFWWLGVLSGLLVVAFGWMLHWTSSVHRVSENNVSTPEIRGLQSKPSQQNALQ